MLIKRKDKKHYCSGGGWLNTPYRDKSIEFANYLEQGQRAISQLTGALGKTMGKNQISKIGTEGHNAGDYSNLAKRTWMQQYGSFGGEDMMGEWSSKKVKANGGNLSHQFAGGGTTTMNQISAWADIGADTAKLYGQNARINEGALNSAKSSIASVVNNKVTSNSFDSLIADQANSRNAFTNYTRKSFQGDSSGKKVFNAALGSVGTSVKGFQATGNWVGAVIGGVAGLAGGLFGMGRAKRQARRQAALANKVAKAANTVQNEKFLNQAAKLKQQQARSYARSFVADGGLLNFGQDMNQFSVGGAIDYANMQQYLNNYRTVGLAKQNALQSVQQQPYMPEMPQISAMYGFGGNLGTNGADFTDGLTYFDAGGRHEENPNQGVPQGIAPDGQPNLVEEGEVKWNEKEYIFSDRLHASEAFLTRWKLPKSYADKTFAYIVKNADVIKEAEQRPNDPASQETMDQFLAELAEDQEQVKQEKEASEIQEQLSQMSDEELAALGQSLQQQQQPQEIIDQPTDYDQLAQNAQEEYDNQQAMQQQVAQQEGLQQPMMGACGGKLHAEGGDLANAELQQNMEDQPQQVNPFTGAVPQEEPPMEMLQQEVPQEEIPQEQAVPEEQPQQKSAEEMSTKELNQAIEDIITYAKEIKDRQLLREAKKIKKASREEKEEFVDEALEEIRETEMEKQQQEIPQEEVPQEQIPQEQMPVEQPMMMAEGGELPMVEEQPIEQLPQESEEQSQVEQPQEEQTEQSQEQKDSITELLNLADSLGMTQDANFTEDEVKKLRKKAEELNIAEDILSNDDAAIADMLNDVIVQKKQEEEANNVATNGEPQVAQEVPQENQFETGGPLVDETENVPEDIANGAQYIRKQNSKDPDFISSGYSVEVTASDPRNKITNPFEDLKEAYNFINSPQADVFQRTKILQRAGKNASKEELLQASIIEETEKRRERDEIRNALLGNTVSVFESIQPKKLATSGKLFSTGGDLNETYDSDDDTNIDSSIDQNQNTEYQEAVEYAKGSEDRIKDAQDNIKKLQKEIDDLKKQKKNIKSKVVQKRVDSRIESKKSNLEIAQKEYKEVQKQAKDTAEATKKATKAVNEYYKAKGIDVDKLDEKGKALYQEDINRAVTEGTDAFTGSNTEALKNFHIGNYSGSTPEDFSNWANDRYYTNIKKYTPINFTEDGKVKIPNFNNSQYTKADFDYKNNKYSWNYNNAQRELNGPNDLINEEKNVGTGLYNFKEIPSDELVYKSANFADNNALKEYYQNAIKNYFTNTLNYSPDQILSSKALNGKQLKEFIASLETGNNSDKELAQIIKANIEDFNNIADDATEIKESEGYKKASQANKYAGQSQEDINTWGKNKSGTNSQIDGLWGLQHFPYLEAVQANPEWRANRLGYLDNNGNFQSIIAPDNFDWSTAREYGNSKIGDITTTDYVIDPTYARNILRVGNKGYVLPEDTDLTQFDALEEAPFKDEEVPNVKGTTNWFGLKQSKDKGTPKNWKPDLNTLMRLAPLFNRPFLDSYGPANMLSSVASNLKWTAAPRHGEYLKYQPVDTLYRQNQIMMDTAAERRGIMNAANSNTGMLMANLALQNSKAQQAIGENLINSETENWNRKKDVINQHNDVDKFYDQLAVEADKANMSNNSLLASAVEKQAELMNKIENSNNTARSAALADRLGILHKIGTEHNALDKYYQHKRWMDGEKAEGGEIIIRRKQRSKRYS